MSIENRRLSFLATVIRVLILLLIVFSVLQFTDLEDGPQLLRASIAGCALFFYVIRREFYQELNYGEGLFICCLVYCLILAVTEVYLVSALTALGFDAANCGQTARIWSMGWFSIMMLLPLMVGFFLLVLSARKSGSAARRSLDFTISALGRRPLAGSLRGFLSEHAVIMSFVICVLAYCGGRELCDQASFIRNWTFMMLAMLVVSLIGWIGICQSAALSTPFRRWLTAS